MVRLLTNDARWWWCVAGVAAWVCTQATPTGACVDDANATLVLSSAEGQKAFGGPVSCAFLASMHACNHPTHGARIREHCKATCGTCPDTCDPDDATVAVASDINITATVPVDDDDDRSASLTWGGSISVGVCRAPMCFLRAEHTYVCGRLRGNYPV